MDYSKPRYILYAGVNGSGKSTLYHSDKVNHRLPRINTDEIARDFGSWEDLKNQMIAGKIAVQRLKSFFEHKISFTQESTLCGKSVLRNIRQAKELGYEVEIHYVAVKNVQICKDRIKYRVLQGGHGIPDKDVERRFLESFMNMKQILPDIDKAYFYDNTYYLTRIAIVHFGKVIFKEDDIPEWCKRIIND